jgi:hypothetical protein
VLAQVDGGRDGEVHGTGGDVEHGDGDVARIGDLLGRAGGGKGAEGDLEVDVGSDVEVLEAQGVAAVASGVSSSPGANDSSTGIRLGFIDLERDLDVASKWDRSPALIAS